jgi:uncharacterized membrane protein
MTLPEIYPWLKALHVASAMVFVGGVLAITIVLTASCPDKGMLNKALRWDQVITSPAMLLVWALGLTLAIIGERFSEFWLQAKLVFVLVLSGIHGVKSGRLRRLTRGGSAQPAKQSPLIVASIVAIAVLAVAKPG